VGGLWCRLAIPAPTVLLGLHTVRSYAGSRGFASRVFAFIATAAFFACGCGILKAAARCRDLKGHPRISPDGECRLSALDYPSAIGTYSMVADGDQVRV
jgi:hypothetical protein